ncbi:unnamed protein product [Caenorhabditis sp. 36 PRJEB53466]|nr:unnamed protein product [Caenorhabditis sp. 36 PRJEB53466]
MSTSLLPCLLVIVLAVTVSTHPIGFMVKSHLLAASANSTDTDCSTGNCTFPLTNSSGSQPSFQGSVVITMLSFLGMLVI